MAREIIWAESLLEAVEYIAKDSPSYASALTVQAEKTAESLSDFAERGRLVPEFRDPNIREVFVRDLAGLLERGEI